MRSESSEGVEAASEAVWEIPAPRSVFEVGLEGEITTTVRRHGNPHADTRLVLSHANGLAVDLYYPFWRLLADDFDLVVYDLRNHGWNPAGAREDHNIPNLIRDHDLTLAEIEHHYGAKPTVGVYHSLSALVSLMSRADRYAALVLFDPPICKPGASEHAAFDEAVERAARRIMRRADRFRSEDEFADLLSYLPGFIRVLPGVRRLMAKTTLRQSPDGRSYELRCPREYEAQVMNYVRSFAPLLDLETLSCPTKVIGGDPTLPSANLPSFDLRHVLAVNYDFVPETTHLLQLEKPEECAAIMRRFLRKIELAQEPPAPRTNSSGASIQ